MRKKNIPLVYLSSLSIYGLPRRKSVDVLTEKFKFIMHDIEQNNRHCRFHVKLPNAFDIDKHSKYRLAVSINRAANGTVIHLQ